MRTDGRRGRATTGAWITLLRRAVAWVLSAWHQPDQYEWITGFLRERGVLHSAQLILATVAASAALVPLALLLEESRPGAGLIIAPCAGGALTLLMAAIWLRRWPSRRESQTAAVLGLACIAAWSQAQPNAALATNVCMAAAITGGYFAFLHSGKLLIVNLVVAITIDALTAVRLYRDTDLATAVSSFWLVWFVNLSVPIAVRGMALAIRLYATRSSQDPLTGLLNRRAFLNAVTALLADADLTKTPVIMAMVDLDNFKTLNDTHGHAVGDRTLRSVADILRNHTTPGAAICRAGGEEFLIAVAGAATDPATLAARLCSAIAELSPAVTASIGTATAATPRPATAAFIDEIIAAADKAMYAAKRLGGNSAHHAWLR